MPLRVFALLSPHSSFLATVFFRTPRPASVAVRTLWVSASAHSRIVVTTCLLWCRRPGKLPARRFHTDRFAMAPTVSEYGAWKSPITSDVAAGSEIQFAGLERDSFSASSDDTIYWLEQRPSEGGRNVVCSWDPKSQKIVSWTPKDFSVKTKVHEYGGGGFCVFKKELYFVNKSDQQIYAQSSADASVRPVTQPDATRRFADLHYSESLNALFAVCEDRGVRSTDKERDEVQQNVVTKEVPDNYLVSINPQNGDLKCLVSGADFYASPKTSHDGRLVWMEWDMPAMPWDVTRIKWTKLSGPREKPNSKEIQELKSINGKTDVAFTFPEFTTSGKILYVSDEDNWWNLFESDVEQKTKRCLEKTEKDLGHPLWIFGMHPFSGVPPSGTDTRQSVALTYGDELSLLTFEEESKVERKTLKTNFQHVHLYYVQAVLSGVYAVGFDAKTPMTLFYYDLKTEKVTNIRASSEVSLEGYLSEAEEVEFPTSNGEVAYGFYYPPKNRDFTAPGGAFPPLLVKNHGGPTSKAYAQLKFPIQFYTSRGFAVFDVNYRGSSGYGRDFRQKLNLKWGVSDVEDAVNGAKYLVSRGLADGNRLCIAGGSAGGLTVLNALLHHDTFKAGASHYGVTDMEALVADTHKFEMRYLDSMVGPYPATKKVYEERSPIQNKEKLKCPAIFFQGTEDAIVPPSQSEKMYEAVKAKGLPCAYVLFEGEGHGFTKKENIQKALETEYAFFVKVFEIEAPHVQCDVQFDNVSA